jgi:hypothetical protein
VLQFYCARTTECQSRSVSGSRLPVREKRQNLFRLKLISNSKCSNFENRTEWMESRAPVRNGLFGELAEGDELGSNLLHVDQSRRR